MPNFMFTSSQTLSPLEVLANWNIFKAAHGSLRILVLQPSNHPNIDAEWLALATR